MKKSLHLLIFYIAMAMLESAVVIYLRELYYPLGFQFPLVGMKNIIIYTELSREAATIIMLWTIAYIAGNSKSSRFAWFLIGFGIWDIFYYIFLYIFIQWPQNIWEWDILFLIPTPWYGPVIAPCIISCLMIFLGSMILHSKPIVWNKMSVISLLLGSTIVLWTFMADFIISIPKTKLPFDQSIILYSQTYIPHSYAYGWFGLGVGLISMGIFVFNKKPEILFKTN